MAKKKTVQEDATCIVDLIQSIINNDMDNTRVNVDKVNTYTMEHPETGFLDLTFKPNPNMLNPCYYYAIEHAHQLENSTSLKFGAMMLETEGLHDAKKAEEVINFVLSKDVAQKLSVRQLTSVVNLCVDMGLYKYLEDIKVLMKDR